MGQQRIRHDHFRPQSQALQEARGRRNLVLFAPHFDFQRDPPFLRAYAANKCRPCDCPAGMVPRRVLPSSAICTLVPAGIARREKCVALRSHRLRLLEQARARRSGRDD